MSCKILVSDDSPTIQKVITIALSDYDVELFESSSNVDTLSKLSNDIFDLLILDANLKGIKQVSDIENIKTHSKTTKILVLVGNFETIDEDSLKTINLTNFLSKPFGADTLIAKINELLPSKFKSMSNTPDLPKIDLDINTNTMPPLPDINLNAVPDDNPEADIKDVLADNILTKFEDDFTQPDPQNSINSIRQNEMRELIRKEVTLFCEDKFVEVAKEIITEELKRLSTEKTKYLTSD